MKNLLLVAGLLFGGCDYLDLNKHVNRKKPCQCERHSIVDDIIVRQSRGRGDDDNEAPSRPDCYAIEKLVYDPSEPGRDIDEQNPLFGVSGWYGVWDNTREHLDTVREYSARWNLWQKVFTNLNDATTYLQSHTELRPLCGGKINVGEL